MEIMISKSSEIDKNKGLVISFKVFCTLDLNIVHRFTHLVEVNIVNHMNVFILKLILFKLFSHVFSIILS